MRQMEYELELKSNPKMKLLPAEKRALPPKHASFRRDRHHEWVKEAKLNCTDSQGKCVQFDCAFTSTMRLADRGQ